MFITSSFLIIMSSNLEITTAGDAPTTTDRADNDFVNGTMENLRIIDSGSEVELIHGLKNIRQSIPKVDLNMILHSFMELT